MKSNSFSQVIPFIWLTATLVSCEFFSSVHEVTKLVDYEQYLLRRMEKFITLNENKLDYLKEKLSLFERNREDSLEEPVQYFKNPINTYLMMKRLSQDWEKLKNIMNYEIGTREHDYNGAIEGILRLQHVYRLSTKDITQGILGGIKYNISELSAKDCFDFGKVAMKTKNLLQAHAWLSEALNRSKHFEPTLMDVKWRTFDVWEMLAEVKFKLGDFKGAAEILEDLTISLPNDSRVLELHNNYRQHQLSEESRDVVDEHEPIPDNSDPIDPLLAYRLTCSGHIHPLPFHQRDLRCGYLTETHPFLLLAPIKVEELHLDPLLVLYHDVIYDSEIEKLIQMASDKMSRALVHSVNGSKVSDVRTSQFVFFDTETDRVLETIDERVADMTGLNMQSAESHQLANYGIGGHYGVHFDYFSTKKDKNGDRIATVLFYLSEVEQGGGTAFPNMRSLVKPKKGAAVFWYNLHTFGDGDIRTRHGACPVLVGSKWVLNRWIRERGQEFKRPCDLMTDAPFLFQ